MRFCSFSKEIQEQQSSKLGIIGKGTDTQIAGQLYIAKTHGPSLVRWILCSSKVFSLVVFAWESRTERKVYTDFKGK